MAFAGAGGGAAAGVGGRGGAVTVQAFASSASSVRVASRRRSGSQWSLPAFASAWGPSKKEAEQKAAYAALEELEILDVPPSDHERLDNSGTKEYSVDAMTPEE